MTDQVLIEGDAYPWVRIEEDGSEFRTHTAHEDGVDENGVEWSGWTYDPRESERTYAYPEEKDPYPWVCLDENNRPFRTHTAHEDGIDENGIEWSGWTYDPRPYSEWAE